MADIADKVLEVPTPRATRSATKAQSTEQNSLDEQVEARIQKEVEKRVKEHNEKQDALKKKEEEEKEKEALEERKNQEAEMQKMLQKKEKTGSEKKQADTEFEVRQKDLQDYEKTWKLKSTELKAEEKHIKDMIELYKKKLVTTTRALAQGDAMLQEKKTASVDAMALAKKKREHHREATRNVDNHPFSQDNRVSRICGICLIENPSVRVVLIACGHLLCKCCAEEQADHRNQPNVNIAKCTLCSKDSNFVRIYENIEVIHTLKRANDGDDEVAVAAKRAKESTDPAEPPVEPNEGGEPDNNGVVELSDDSDENEEEGDDEEEEEGDDEEEEDV